ncbi:putative membrane protein, partial [Acinetobacter baumannii 45002_9]
MLTLGHHLDQVLMLEIVLGSALMYYFATEAF